MVGRMIHSAVHRTHTPHSLVVVIKKVCVVMQICCAAQVRIVAPWSAIFFGGGKICSLQ